MKKLIQSTQREFVDVETGEVKTIETSKTSSQKIKEDNFYMTFIDYVAPFYNLKSDNARKLLVWMCEHAEFNTGKVSLTTKKRQEIAETINISSNTITNNLSVLKKAGLISGEKGEFVINPQIFWKGDLNTRRKFLETAEFKVKFSIEE